MPQDISPLRAEDARLVSHSEDAPVPTDRHVGNSEVTELARRIRGQRETWVVTHRVGGKRKKVTLGACSGIPLERARALARALLAGSGEADEAPCPEMKLEDFAARFFEDCAGQWKSSTLKSHRTSVRLALRGSLGRKTIGAPERADVLAWFNAPGPAQGSRNRALAVLSSICTHAELLGLRPPGSNPCKGLRRKKSSFDASYLDDAGYSALGRALEGCDAEHPAAVATIRFIALTGCRKGEALGLTWAMIEGNRAALPDAKSGPKAMWLGKPVRDLLAGLPRCGEYVFSADGAPFTNTALDKVWHPVREDMGRPALRLHDLRHSFASVGVRQGHDLIVIGGLLGHADKGTTAGYAHLDGAPLKAASARVGRHLERVMQGPKKREPGGPVTPDHLCRAFSQSKLSVKAFCEKHGLKQARFRHDYTRWRVAIAVRRKRA